MKTWSNGKIIDGKRSIDSFNYSLHYSSPVVWEGMRAYVQEDGNVRIWKLREHVERLKDSAKIVGFEIPFTVGQIEQACLDVVEANGNKDMYLRPIAFNEVDAEGIIGASQNISLDIYCVPIPPLHKNGEAGIKMAVSNVVRGYPQYQMQAKTSANYQAVQLTAQQLKQMGVNDVFMTDNHGYIVEATVANFFVFKGDVVMTPPNNGSILPGITRKTIAEILMDSSVMLKKYLKSPLLMEKNITKADLYTADCVILCGTYAEVINVVEIDGRKIGNDDSRFYYKMLAHEYSNLVRGKRK